jgi:chorismate dehydratase
MYRAARGCHQPAGHYNGRMTATAIVPGQGFRQPSTRTRPIRLGVVSFVNTLPLIDGLENLRDVELRRSVPSLLIDQLVSGEIELALCSSIDYQRSSTPLVILPVGLLGCHGPTLTVRLYSTQPLKRIERVYCDTDSHTSIALMRILLKEMHGLEPELIDYDAREHVAANRPIEWPDTMLLIGDKVVTDSPPAVRYPHQLDLGAAWAEHTGLPFVFALWMARSDADPTMLRTAGAVLDHQRRHNLQRIDQIIHHRAKPRQWPGDLASSYLKQNLLYLWTERARDGLEMFYDKALQHGLIAMRRSVKLIEG